MAPLWSICLESKPIENVECIKRIIKTSFNCHMKLTIIFAKCSKFIAIFLFRIFNCFSRCFLYFFKIFVSSFNLIGSCFPICGKLFFFLLFSKNSSIIFGFCGDTFINCIVILIGFFTQNFHSKIPFFYNKIFRYSLNSIPLNIFLALPINPLDTLGKLTPLSATP